MSNSKNNRTVPEQLLLLDIREGNFADIPHLVRAALVKAIKNCPLSRYQIAARISELMDRDLTKEMLDKYCSESAEGHRLPAEIIPAFCKVTGSLSLLKIFAEPMACTFLDSTETQALEIVRLRLEREKLQNKIRELEKKRK